LKLDVDWSFCFVSRMARAELEELRFRESATCNYAARNYRDFGEVLQESSRRGEGRRHRNRGTDALPFEFVRFAKYLKRVSLMVFALHDLRFRDLNHLICPVLRVAVEGSWYRLRVVVDSVCQGVPALSVMLWVSW